MGIKGIYLTERIRLHVFCQRNHLTIVDSGYMIRTK
jgi:hypothetical protein